MLESSVQIDKLADRLDDLTRPVTDLDEGLLISATYDGDKKLALLKFYDPRLHRIWIWYDNSGHKPYCYTKLPLDELNEVKIRSDVTGIEEAEKLDLLSDKQITVRKIVAKDPLAIGGTSGNSVRDIIKAWEADIKYYENYVYDNGLRIGTYYKVKGGTVIPLEKGANEQVVKSLESVLSSSEPGYAKHIKEWADLLGQPLCDFKRMALDIEVENEENRIPDPEKADRRVLAVSFVDGVESSVYLLQREGKGEPQDLASTRYRASFFKDEASLLRATFRKMTDYPLLITFNGDDFDLRYLKHRAENLGVTETEIPIQLQRQEASLKHGVHIDLYRFFNNRSIQVYAFSNKYTEHTLNAIAEALLNKSKLEFEGDIGDLPAGELANYCVNDSEITYEFTNMNSSVLMKLLLVLSRIAKMPMNDVARLGVSNWIRSMLFFEHRKINALIPRSDELLEKGGASSQAIIKGKKYKGGLVIEPQTGVHFGVSVLDFASLYPSIIKVYNLSYETVNCPHEECRSNLVPDTTTWVCKKRKGITSTVIGSLRDLRVNHYKPLSRNPNLSKDERELYNVVSQGLKVTLNAGYGVMGFETFALYCLPVAEATAALGRYAITKTIDKCKDLGISVVYGDTDSLFLENTSKDQIGIVSRWVEQELGVELDLDKTYRYVAFSGRKKNYFGVLIDGTVDIKGLTGKKSQTPEFLKETFYDSLKILSSVQNPSDFESAKSRIKELLTRNFTRLRNKEIPVEALAFNVMIGRLPSKYSETTPQHVKAARLLEEKGREIKAGEVISYVKTKTPPNVKPASMARPDDIDVDKYLEYARSMFDQMLDAMGFGFDEIMGATTLDLFWS